MKSFLFIFHTARKSSPMSAWNDYVAMLHAGKHLIGGSSLGHGEGLRAGATTAVKAKTLGGYMVIQAPSIAKARALAKQSPTHAHGGTVDIFPLVMS